jgi:hypothetical protein
LTRIGTNYVRFEVLPVVNIEITVFWWMFTEVSEEQAASSLD